MFKRQKEIDRKVDELVAELYEVEGEITDYLCYYYIESYKFEFDYENNISNENRILENLKENNLGFSIIRTLTLKICDEILPWSDGNIENVIIEVTGRGGEKYYFLDVRESIPFDKGDGVKVFIGKKEYKNCKCVYAITHQKKRLLWTPVSIVRGRVESLKQSFSMLMGIVLIQTIFFTFLGLFFLLLCLFPSKCIGELYIFAMIFLFSTAFIFVFGSLFIFYNWIFPDEHNNKDNINSEAVFKKLGFHAVKNLDLSKYSMFNLSKKRNVEVNSFDNSKQAVSYLLEIGLREHNQKYNKGNYV